MGQTLAAIRGMEIRVGSALYQLKKSESPAEQVGIAMQVLEGLAKDLADLRD